MIYDLSKLGNLELPEYDVCIVGSGPAGITVANELKNTDLQICVLESGKLKPTKHGDRLREVQSQGIQIKEYSRERILGGTSTTWSGLSSPLAPIDMKPRPFLRHSGWPIGPEELVPYYEKAARSYRFPPLHFFAADALGSIKRKGEIQPSWNELEEKIFLAASEPQNFGQEFREIFEILGVDLYLDATLVRLEGNKHTYKVTAAIIQTSGGRTFRLKAKVFVLATGAVENARILLNTTGLCPRGLGNEQDQVGRYMMNHPKNKYGFIRLNRSVKELPYYFGCLFNGYAGYAGLRLKETIQEERGLLNSYVRFEPLSPWSGNQGVEALVFFVKRCKALFRGWKKSKEGQIVPLRDYSETGDDTELQSVRRSSLEWVELLLKVLLNIHYVLKYLYFRILAKEGPKIKVIRLRNFMEMEPDPENRIVLSEEKDIYGQPIPVVRHRSTELDRQSLIALHDTLAEEVSHNGFGQLIGHLQEEEPWPIDLDASHHLGTTRMGEDIRTSVVNSDCRLHEVDNVYLAGGSVFPTSGCSNPTLTIVALSIRLAKHLKKKVVGLR